MYEPGTPIDAGSRNEIWNEIQCADAEELGEGIQGPDIPGYQQLGPVWREKKSIYIILVDEEEIIVNNSSEKLRRATRYPCVLSWGSRQEIFQKIKEKHVTGLRMQALEAARQEYGALDPKPRFTDAPKQPFVMERKVH